MISKKILLSIFVILSNVGFAGAATLNVGQGQTYTTIQAAVDAAAAGDVISVDEGTYYENLIVKKGGIFIIGKNKEKTIIDAQKTGSAVRIEADGVIISGFTVQNNGGSGKDDAGISLYSASNNIVANSILVNNTVGVAIYSASDNNTISGNYIKWNGRNGILIYSSNDNKIYDNNIQSNQIGIYADSARTSRIYSNNFIDNKDQAYDNSGLNSWDDESSGNYWSTYKGSGAFSLLGGANAKDNYPLPKPAAIKDVPVPTPSQPGIPQNQEQKLQGKTDKSSPEFAGIMALVSLMAAGILRNRKRRWQ